MLDASVTLWNDLTGEVSSKSLYRNSKGVYFNTSGKKKSVYIIKEGLPEHMK